LVLEEEMRAACDELTVMTDDGSHGRRGLVVEPLREAIASGQQLDRVLAVGPVRMMQSVAEATRAPGIPTIVSLNALMVDGTGMCGGCRVITAHGARFACVDGPEFDAHSVDFGILAQRNQAYRDRESEELREYAADPERWLKEVRAEMRAEMRTAALTEPDAGSLARDAARRESGRSPECRLEAAHPELRS
jgi:ferredoxin--NADP+ reductase